VRPWNGKRWITCALEFKGWVAPKWELGRWTALFFYDEAVAFAAGHRPCALCRRPDYLRYCAALGMKSADDIDARLHADRLDGRRQRLHIMRWTDVPAGAFVDLHDGPALAGDGELRPWSTRTGYGATRPRPAEGDAVVITPAANIVALRAGYALS
jgi:hypothetical protein